MLHWHRLGLLPPKPHTTLYENGKLLLEQMITREGFHGPYSILYYRQPPTEEVEVREFTVPGFAPVELAADDGGLKRRHIRTQDLPGGGDYLTGRRTMLVSDALDIGILKPRESTRVFFSNGDGDELYFIKQGSGRVESVYGILPFREHDYVLIPKGTPYRLYFDESMTPQNPPTLVVFEGRPEIRIPGDYRNKWGQITDYAPYSHRDFRVPTELLPWRTSDTKSPIGDGARRRQDRALDEHGNSHDDPLAPPYEIVMKRRGVLSLHRYPHFPLEVVGWDGCVYPIAFNIHDYQPKTGLVHLPPTIHTTFAGDQFVICSFVPRLLDYHEQAIPCPYAHANVDMDEILYYVAGNFTSRRGIDAESVSLHPAGVTHGPHPGTYEKSIGVKRTDELAVMVDCYPPFRLTKAAAGVEDANYHMTWLEGESARVAPNQQWAPSD